MNLDQITCMLLLFYLVVMFVLAIKFQAGYFIKDEFRKPIPEKFMFIICISLLVLIIILAFAVSVLPFKGSRMMLGFIVGMMFYNFATQFKK